MAADQAVPSAAQPPWLRAFSRACRPLGHLWAFHRWGNKVMGVGCSDTAALACARPWASSSGRCTASPPLPLSNLGTLAMPADTLGSGCP